MTPTPTITPTATPSTGQVEGHIWHDTNSDGVWQSWESLLRGAQVDIKAEKQPGFHLTMYALDGRYLFVGLPPDTYIVQETNPPNYTSTTPDKVLAQVTANTLLEINFGNVASPQPTITLTPTATSTPRPTKTPTPVTTTTPAGSYRLYLPLLQQ